MEEIPQENTSASGAPTLGREGREEGVDLCAGTRVARMGSFKGDKVERTSQYGEGTRDSWSTLSNVWKAREGPGSVGKK